MSDCFRDEVHDEALYKSTFLLLLYFARQLYCCCCTVASAGNGARCPEYQAFRVTNMLTNARELFITARATAADAAVVDALVQ